MSWLGRSGLLALGLWLAASHAIARGPNDSAENLERAKAMFRRGVLVLEAGDLERALELFLGSRALVPSAKNTVNAAICLEQLNRKDEALELYEDVMARFTQDLEADDRKNLVPVMERLRRQIAYLEVSSNVDGLVVVDGRPRGRLPFQTALRLMPGKRMLRIVKDGYRSYERQIEVRAGSAARIDVRLEPLAGLSALRVEDVTGKPIGVFVDGKRVGTTPWEGTLATGVHAVQTFEGDIGSAPTRVMLDSTKAVLLRLHAQRLGPRAVIHAEPESATLSLGDVPLGHGSYQGRLPLGRYEVRATAEGYLPALAALEITPGAPARLKLDLRRDTSWQYGLGLALGPSFAVRLGSGAESSCPDYCDGGLVAFGGFVQALIAARHRSGFGFGLSGGYLFSKQELERRAFDSYRGIRVTYALHQELLVGGPFALATAIAGAKLTGELLLESRLGLGIALLTAQTQVSGVAFTNQESLPLRTTAAGRVREATPLATAALVLQVPLGPLLADVAMQALYFPARGPAFGGPELGVSPEGCVENTPVSDVSCSPNSTVLARERAWSRALVLSPRIGLEHRF